MFRISYFWPSISYCFLLFHFKILMKSLKVQFFLFVLLIGTASAQSPMTGVFNGSTKVTFLGLDFTNAKFVGAAGFTNPDAIQSQFLASWNNLIVAEPKKFSLEDPLRLKGDQYQTKVDDFIKLNEKVNVAANITNESQTLTAAKVEASVSKYKLSEKEGVGVAYVVENLDKTAEKMTVWVTFIDLKTKKVLLTEPVEGKAVGFTFRNYWAGAVANINKAIKSNYFKKWSKTYKI